MKTRENKCHYVIIFFVLAIILIGFSGYVQAAPSDKIEELPAKTPVSLKSPVPRIGNEPDGADEPEDYKEPDAGDAGDDKEDEDYKEGGDLYKATKDDYGEDDDDDKAAWEKLVVDDEDDEGKEFGFARAQMRADFGPPVGEDNLNGLLAMVKWRNTDHKFNKNEENVGWYDTLGTVISKVAILAVPSSQLRVDPNLGTASWYVKQVLLRLDDVNARIKLTKKDYRIFYPDHFPISRDEPHRFALIILNKKLDDGVRRAKIVMNPLTPAEDTAVRADEPEYFVDDFTVTACTMVVCNTDPKTSTIRLSGIPVITSKCVYDEENDKKGFYDSKVCVNLKVPYYPKEALSDRALYPNDVGSPLFCNGYLSGVYAGVQNLAANKYGGKLDARAGTLASVKYTGKLNSHDEQYTFEIPGEDKNWRFITSFTGDQDGIEWSPNMEVLEDEVCLPPPDEGGDHVSTTPGSGGEETEEGGDVTEGKGSAVTRGSGGNRPQDSRADAESKSKATRTFKLSLFLSAAAVASLLAV